MAGAGWYPDPLGRAQVRYFDGTEWSQWAADDGKSRLDAEAVLTALPAPPDAPPPGMPPPPGTGWTPSQQAGPGVMQFRSLRGLATALTWVLPFTILAGLAAAGAFVNRIDAADTYYHASNPSTFASSFRDLQDADDAVGSTTTISVLLAIAVFVLLIIFMFRAAKNNELWNAQRPTWAAGWTIGGWFIPVASWVIPFLVFREIWLRSIPEGSPRKLPAIVWVWWVSYVVGTVALVIDPDYSTFDELRLRDGAHAAGLVVLGVSGVLLIVIVRRFAALQRARADAVGQ
jgi:hypothetical protein